MGRDLLLEQQLHNLWLAITRRIMEGCVLVVVNGVQVGLGLQQGIHAGHLTIPACKVQSSPALFILLVLVCPRFKELFQGCSIAYTQPSPSDFTDQTFYAKLPCSWPQFKVRHPRQKSQTAQPLLTADKEVTESVQQAIKAALQKFHISYYGAICRAKTESY